MFCFGADWQRGESSFSAFMKIASVHNNSYARVASFGVTNSELHSSEENSNMRKRDKAAVPKY